jgi:hypothetical protein
MSIDRVGRRVRRRIAPADGQSAESGITRRELLKRGVGATVLVAAPDLLSSTSALGAPGNAAAGFFFLFGIADPATASSLEAGRPPAPGVAGLSPIATELAALPVTSPNGTKLALVTVEDHGAAAVVKMRIVDKQSAAAVSTGTLTLPRSPDALILVTPTFAADSATLCLVLSITVPTARGTGTKLNPNTGEIVTVPTTTWVSHHALAYFNSDQHRVTGPFDLADAPSLARVNVGATANDLFLWTLAEPAATPGPTPETQLAVFPLESGKPRLTVPAPGAWPVNEEPTVSLSNGKVARLVYSEQIELYSSKDGSRTSLTIAPFAEGSTKPAPATMQLRPDGRVFLSKPAIGKAVIVDPLDSFRVVSSVAFPPPELASGGPSGKAALAADGKTVYVLGSAQDGGISAYDASSGTLVASHADGLQYAGLYALPSGALVAVKDSSPRLSFFDSSLNAIGVADTNLHVVEVF